MQTEFTQLATETIDNRFTYELDSVVRDFFIVQLFSDFRYDRQFQDSIVNDPEGDHEATYQVCDTLLENIIKNELRGFWKDGLENAEITRLTNFLFEKELLQFQVDEK